MKKNNKKDTINLFFSAFLILAFIVCAYFFTQFTNTIPGVGSTIITVLIYVVFGLLVFYATRVGDGKAQKRFSLVTLIVLDIPALYIIIAALAPGLPLNNLFVAESGVSVIVSLACVALGYGIPYTFFSGFETADETEKETVNETEIVEGGIEEDLLNSAVAENEDEVQEESTSEETIADTTETIAETTAE